MNGAANNLLDELRVAGSGGQVPLRVKVRYARGLALPVEEGQESEGEVSAIFRGMTFEDFAIIEDLVAVDYKLNEHETLRELDFSGMRWYMMRRLPLVWNLPIPLTYENGWLVESSWQRVRRLPGPLVAALLAQYEPSSSISEEEQQVIDRQSVTLFSDKGGAVMGACKAVSLYCQLSGMWDKVGLNRWDVARLPYREYLMLRRMMDNDNEATRRRMKVAKGTGQSKAKIIRGGRSVPSGARMTPDG